MTILIFHFFKVCCTCQIAPMYSISDHGQQQMIVIDHPNDQSDINQPQTDLISKKKIKFAFTDG